MKTAICKTCEKELPQNSDFFHTSKRWFHGSCKSCRNRMSRERYQRIGKMTASEKYLKNKETILQKRKEYYEKNKDRILIQKREYRDNNKEKLKAKRDDHYKKNKKEILKRNADYYRRRCKFDATFRLKQSIRARAIAAIEAYSSNGKVAPSKHYGIDYEKIVKHLGPCPGKRERYHVDHIFPLSAFNFNDPFEIWAAFHFRNHQWLEASQNIRKHASCDKGEFQKYLDFIRYEYEELR